MEKMLVEPVVSPAPTIFQIGKTLASIVAFGASGSILFFLLVLSSHSPQRSDESLAGMENPRFRRNLGFDSSPNVAKNEERQKEEASDVFISVKTTKDNHESRLRPILDTWFQKAKDKVYFFSDASPSARTLKEVGQDHWIVTDCSAAHSRQALCCKMGHEYDHFMKSQKSWFCHFDDDNYVNIAALEKLLSKFDASKDHYLGRPSTRKPIEISNRDDENPSPKDTVTFWFATGGAGFCISRPLAEKMEPLAGSGDFAILGEKIRLPDDVTLGYLIEHLLNKKLTIITELHSHLENLRSIPLETLKDQVSLSYGTYNGVGNVVDIPGYFSEMEDNTRFYSIHCHLFPTSSKRCQQFSENLSS